MDKKPTNSRGRIMQVVEVDEDTDPKQKVDVPPPSEIKKDETPSFSNPIDDKQEENTEKPDIASSFGAPFDSRGESNSQGTAHEQQPDISREKEMQPLKTEEKRDIVSELFETKKAAVTYPDISIDRKSSPFGFIMWVLVLLAIVGCIGGGLLYLKQKSLSNESVPSAVLTPSPTPAVVETETPIASASGKTTGTPTKTASPSSTPKKTGLTIQVLNGSGEKGVASTMKTFLEGKGYTVVGTGNAKNFDYTKTEIIIKADKTTSLDKLKTDLSANYSVGSTSATLDSTASYDAQVIIGKE